MYNMVNIYKITDINGLCYVGSTRSDIRHRLANHTYSKNNNNGYCSSHKLDLENCEIEVLEVCKPEIRYEREKYYINTIDCVNERKMNFDRKEYIRKYLKHYRENNKEKIKEKIKEYHEKNNDEIKVIQRQYREQNKDKLNKYKRELRSYKNSWGGDIRFHNNLLEIDVNLFQ